MVFSSIPFLYYFLPLVLICYFAVPFRFKNFILLIFSLVFYSWGEPRYIILMVFSIIMAYAEGFLLGKTQRKKAAVVLAAACCVHIGLLICFKYTDFLIENVNAVGGHIPLIKLALPVGISFYTFQILSYLVDVYRKNCQVQKNLISFGAYVSMFPQLIAGPIVRYSDIEKQLVYRTHTVDQAALGIRRFMLGMGKRVLLANSLGKLCDIFQITSDPSVLYYWLYAIAFCLQIYFDFSGYSDMAIGLGKIFGFHFPENFDYPYVSKSIQEFWRRWHMTLGSWFRDYVYISMGGNRVSKGRWFFNIATVWFLTGLWHGAAWNFVVWGLMFAVLLLVEKAGFLHFLNRHKVFSHIYVMLMVAVSFVIFNAADMKEALQYLRVMFTGGSLPFLSQEFLYYLRSYGVILLLAIVGATPMIPESIKKLREKKWGNTILNIVEPIFLVLLFVVITSFLVNDSYNPFLYFRF